MSEVALPELAPKRQMRAVVVDDHLIAGELLYAVELYLTGRAPKRRWFASRAIALAHAADRGDEHGVPMLDLTDGGADQ